MRSDRTLFLFLILMVALPSILLSIFAVNALVGQKILIEEKIKKSYETLAYNTRRRIFEELDKHEEVVKSFVSKFHQTGQVVRPSNFPLDNSLFSKVFLVTADYQVVYPEERPSYSVSQQITFSDNDSKFYEGYVLEYQEKDYSAAILEYEKIMAEEKEQNFKSSGNALVAIARCYLKMQKYDQSLETYHHLTTLFNDNSNLMGLNFVIAAKYQIAEIYRRQEQWKQGYLTLTRLLKDIIFNEYRLKASQYEHYYQRVTNLLEEMKEQIPPLEKAKLLALENYEDIIEGRNTKLQEERNVKNARKHLLPELRILVSSTAKSSGYIFYRDEERQQLAYFLEVPELPKDVGFIICELNFSYWIQEVILPILESQEAGKDVFMTLMDQGKSISGNIQKQFSPVVSLSMAPKFPFWEMAVYLKDIRSLDDLTRDQSYLYFGGIVIVIMVFLVGVCGFIVTLIRRIKSARLKSDFVSNVTHELKTPLTAIKMFVETLLMGRVTSKEEEKECLQIISSESERLSRLIDRILDFAKMEQRRRTFDFELANIAEIVETTVAQFKKQIPEESCQFLVQLDEKLPHILIDEEAISEALINLLSNAYKYIDRAERKIEVLCRLRREYIAITIKDNGVGIPRHDMQRIFEKFYRVENTLTRPVEGTGLGLPLVSSIVKAHNGKIKVQSKVGVGSEFTIRLPLKVN